MCGVPACQPTTTGWLFLFSIASLSTLSKAVQEGGMCCVCPRLAVCTGCPFKGCAFVGERLERLALFFFFVLVSTPLPLFPFLVGVSVLFLGLLEVVCLRIRAHGTIQFERLGVVQCLLLAQCTRQRSWKREDRSHPPQIIYPPHSSSTHNATPHTESVKKREESASPNERGNTQQPTKKPRKRERKQRTQPSPNVSNHPVLANDWPHLISGSHNTGQSHGGLVHEKKPKS